LMSARSRGSFGLFFCRCSMSFSLFSILVFSAVISFKREEEGEEEEDTAATAEALPGATPDMKLVKSEWKGIRLQDRVRAAVGEVEMELLSIATESTKRIPIVAKTHTNTHAYRASRENEYCMETSCDEMHGRTLRCD
jgi:hypothetical protein